MTYVKDATPETNGRIKVPQTVIYVLIFVITTGLSGLVGYFRGASEEQQKRSDLAADVLVLKEQVGALRQQVNEMRIDVKELLSQRRQGQ
jgi:outer membrane murein-binding lipoprotein Lpp